MSETESTLLLRNIKKQFTMKSEQQELSKLFTSVEESQSKENLTGELLEREQVGTSPLWILGNKVDGYFLAIGKQRLSDVYKTADEVRDAMEDNKWQIIGNYVLQLIELYNNFEKMLVEAEKNIEV